jgi:hypothetical protein
VWPHGAATVELAQQIDDHGALGARVRRRGPGGLAGHRQHHHVGVGDRLERERLEVADHVIERGQPRNDRRVLQELREDRRERPVPTHHHHARLGAARREVVAHEFPE